MFDTSYEIFYVIIDFLEVSIVFLPWLCLFKSFDGFFGSTVPRRHIMKTCLVRPNQQDFGNYSICRLGRVQESPITPQLIVVMRFVTIDIMVNNIF